MSSIVGIYRLDGRPVDFPIVERMLDSTAPRGPDRAGVWIEGPVGLGQRTLWTTPESLKERQPLQSEDGHLWLTADARVDNRRELKAELESKGTRFTSDTDAELILRAYQAWGEDCPKKILGDFAFVLWDSQRQRLFCARDPIGSRPLYYFFDGKSFRWASAPESILDGGRLSREPNLKLICLYLSNRFDEPGETLYRSVYRLPPAHCMLLEHGQLRQFRYWDVEPDRAIRYRTDAQYGEQFLELFQDAVRTRMRSRGPVGVLLSGGLDSSSVVCTARGLQRRQEIPNQGLETFSVTFDEYPCDERRYIEEVVSRCGSPANYVNYERERPWVDFEQARQYPPLLYSPTLFINAPLLETARQKGIRVLLDGMGGDDLLAPAWSDHFADLLRQGRFGSLVTQIRENAALFSCSPLSLLVNQGLRPLIPGPVKSACRPLLEPFRNDGIPSWVDKASLAKMGINGRRDRNEPRFRSRVQQGIYRSLANGWNTNVALPMGEAFTARFGIEIRHPFLDRRLVEFLMALPPEQLCSRQWPKAVLRRAMQGILPESIRVRRRKANFSCLVDGELRHRQAGKVEDLLHNSRLAALGAIHADRLQRLFQRYRAGETQDSSARRTFQLVVALELWCRSAAGGGAASDSRGQGGGRGGFFELTAKDGNGTRQDVL